MMQIGQYNLLTVLRETSIGLYLGDEEGNDILLPKKYVSPGTEVDDEIEVFVYKDNEGRPIATTLMAKASVGEFAYLEVNQVNKVGAFLDWGIDKDLLVPYREQPDKMEVGKKYLVYIYIDDVTERITASTRVYRFYEQEDIRLQVGDEVDLMIGHYTDIGFQVIINNEYKGLVYRDEVFKELRTGYRTKGYVKNIRPDKKIDVSLQKIGFANIEPNAEKILKKLRVTGGFMPLHDKSDPDEIKEVMSMSKKTFKKAIGTLYKDRLIQIEPDGIRLIEEETE